MKTALCERPKTGCRRELLASSGRAVKLLGSSRCHNLTMSCSRIGWFCILPQRQTGAWRVSCTVFRDQKESRSHRHHASDNRLQHGYQHFLWTIRFRHPRLRYSPSRLSHKSRCQRTPDAPRSQQLRIETRRRCWPPAGKRSSPRSHHCRCSSNKQSHHAQWAPHRHHNPRLPQRMPLQISISSCSTLELLLLCRGQRDQPQRQILPRERVDNPARTSNVCY